MGNRSIWLSRRDCSLQSSGVALSVRGRHSMAELFHSRRACFYREAEYHLEEARFHSFTARSLFSSALCHHSVETPSILKSKHSPPLHLIVLPSSLALSRLFLLSFLFCLFSPNCKVYLFTADFYEESSTLDWSSIPSCQLVSRAAPQSSGPVVNCGDSDLEATEVLASGCVWQ